MDPAVSDPTISRRWRIDDHGSEYIITIQRKWSWLTFAVEPLIACVIIYSFPQLKAQALQSKLVFAISVLAALGLIKGLLWNLGGREIITVTNNELRLRREIFGFGWQCTFELKRVSDISYQEAEGGEDGHKAGIVFDYSGTLNPMQRRFGDDLTKTEAHELIDSITKRFPQLNRCTPDEGHFITLGLNS